MNNDERLIDIEMALTEIQKSLDDLNEVVIRQGKQIDQLGKKCQLLLDVVKNDSVKPLSEETPPPHY